MAYPAVLQELVDEAGYAYQVINAGATGETSAGGLRWLDWVLQNRDVEISILALGAQVLTFLLSSRVLEIPFRPAILVNSVTIILAAVAVSVVGVIVTLDVVRHKPLTILRVG